MTDAEIVKTLRHGNHVPYWTCEDAANLIEQQAAQIAALVEALTWVRQHGLVASAAFVRRNADGAVRMADVLNRIDDALASIEKDKP